MNTFTREVKITPAWDSGTREHGQHGCDLLFLLHGTKGTLLFEVFTGWYLKDKARASTPANVSYHSHNPIYEDDSIHGECDWLKGKPCYSNSLCCSTEMFRVLVEKGSEGLWEQMETLYGELFDKEPEWLVAPYEQMAAAVGA
jgi:hypothetical protein